MTPYTDDKLKISFETNDMMQETLFLLRCSRLIRCSVDPGTNTDHPEQVQLSRYRVYIYWHGLGRSEVARPRYARSSSLVSTQMVSMFYHPDNITHVKSKRSLHTTQEDICPRAFALHPKAASTALAFITSSTYHASSAQIERPRQRQRCWRGQSDDRS
jgi:hypothetical protein